MGLAVVAGVCTALQPLVVKYVVDNGILREGADSTERLKWVLIFGAGYFLLSLFRVVFWTMGYRFMVKYLEGVVFQIRTNFFLHVQRLCLRFHEKTGTGELFNYIMGSPVAQMKQFLTQAGMMVPALTVSWVVAVFALGSFDWRLTLIMIGTAVLVVVVNQRSRKTIRAQTNRYMEEESQASKLLADLLQGNRNVQIAALEESTGARFLRQMTEVRQQGEALSVRQQFEGIKPEFLQYLTQGVVLVTGGIFCVQGTLSVGAYTAFVSSTALLTGPLVHLAQLGLTLSSAEAGMHRIHSILGERTTTPEASVPSEPPADLPARGKVLAAFHNVTFSYTDRKVFTGFSCELRVGERLALVGHSGSGKSTFVSLLLRLYEVDAGAIELLGRPIREYSLRALRQMFGVVPQFPHLFQTSIRENLLLVRPSASEDEIEEALRAAQAWEFVQRLPEGLQTVVGKEGFSISGGERQRLALARALLQKPKILVLDEATSALDTFSERAILRALGALPPEMTTITIAHRLSTIRQADRILVFQEGRVAEEGRYDDLIAIGNVFAGLVREAEEGPA